MPFREKAAWLALFAMAVTVGPYFTLAAMDGLPAGTWAKLGAYGVAALAQLAILGAGHLWLRWQAPDEAKAPEDEREQTITLRARTLSYYVMLSGFVWVGVIMPFGASGWRITNAALFMIVAAEVVHYASVIFQYRRQAL